MVYVASSAFIFLKVISAVLYTVHSVEFVDFFTPKIQGHLKYFILYHQYFITKMFYFELNNYFVKSESGFQELTLCISRGTKYAWQLNFQCLHY